LVSSNFSEIQHGTFHLETQNGRQLYALLSPWLLRMVPFRKSKHSRNESLHYQTGKSFLKTRMNLSRHALSFRYTQVLWKWIR